VSLTLLRPRVRANVRDTGARLVDPADYDAALQAAVAEYSARRPLERVADVAGDGGYDYPLPDGWPAVDQVEYPAGDRVPRVLDALDWSVYRLPAGPVLRFASATPGAGESIRLTRRGLHAIDADSTTVPADDFEAVVRLASAVLCEQLASIYSDNTAPAFGADTVDHKSQASEWAARAKRFRTLAAELLPGDAEDGLQPASGTASWAESDTGWWPLSHRPRG
jgi:hypothetical protein